MKKLLLMFVLTVIALCVTPIQAILEESSFANGVFEGAARGFQSDIKVIVTLDDDNKIATITIESGDETPGFGTRCAEDAAFINQFIGKTAPFAIGENIDALAGATVTSRAVVDAVNSVFPTQDMSLTPAGETYEGAAQGFQSEVKVRVTVDNGVITALTILSGNETPGFGTRCSYDMDFVNQFIGKKIPVTVDALSGATVTSNAIVEAINSIEVTSAIEHEDMYLFGPTSNDITENNITVYLGCQTHNAYGNDFLDSLTLKELKELQKELNTLQSDISTRIKSLEYVEPEDLGMWEMKYYVDEFKLPTDEPYFRNSYLISGTFNNSAVRNEELLARILIDRDGVSFMLYEYKDNQVMSYGTNYYSVLILDSLNQKHCLNGVMYRNGDRIHLDDSDVQTFIAILTENEKVSFYIQNRERTIDTYSFTINNTSYFKNAYDKLLAE